MKSDTNTEIERHKLVIDKPWFSHSMSEINSLSSIDSPVSAPIVSEEFIPDAVPSIPYSSSIYDINTYSETNQQTQNSSATDRSRGSRLRPRFVVDKISKLFIFRKRLFGIDFLFFSVLLYHICILIYKTLLCYVILLMLFRTTEDQQRILSV